MGFWAPGLGLGMALVRVAVFCSQRVAAAVTAEAVVGAPFGVQAAEHAELGVAHRPLAIATAAAAPVVAAAQLGSAAAVS